MKLVSPEPHLIYKINMMKKKKKKKDHLSRKIMLDNYPYPLNSPKNPFLYNLSSLGGKQLKGLVQERG